MADNALPTPSTTNNRQADLIAGLSIAGLLLPEAVAYSGIANMPAQAGVIGLLAGLLLYGLIGTSRFAIVSATSSSAALLAAVTMSVAGANAQLQLAVAMGLVVVTGLVFVIAGFAKLGDVSSFISKPVLRGFSFGLAVVIIIKQLPKMVNFHPSESAFVPYAFDLFRHLTQWNLAGLGTGLVALVLLFVLERWRKLPGALLVIALGIAAGHYLQLEHFGVAQVGTIALQLSTPHVPDLERAQWMRIGELAFAMMLVLYAESYSSIRTYAVKHGDATSPNRDLLALGVANIVSGALQGVPVGAGFSGTSANEAAGAQSKWAAWIAAVVAIAIIAAVLPLLALTPEPVLAAIVIHAVSHALNPAVLRPYFNWKRDRVVLIAAIAGVLILGVLDGLLMAIGVSLLMTLRGFSSPRVSELGHLGDEHSFVAVNSHPGTQAVPGLLILRPESPLFFANIDGVASTIINSVDAKMASQPKSLQSLIVSLEESPDLDGTTIEGIAALADKIRGRGLVLRLARVKDAALQVLMAASVANVADLAQSGLSVEDAVQAALQANHNAMA